MSLLSYGKIPPSASPAADKPRHAGGARRPHVKPRFSEKQQWRHAASLLAELHADASSTTAGELVDGIDHILGKRVFDGPRDLAFRQARQLLRGRADRRTARIFLASKLREAIPHLDADERARREADAERFDLADVAGVSGNGQRLAAFEDGGRN